VVDAGTRLPAVAISGVSRRFGDADALREVSLDVEAGEIHALLGPNGAGKTTLLRIVCGLVDADHGEIRLMGVPLERLGFREHRRLIGLVPSGDRSFYLRISGLENLIFFGRLHGLSRRAASERALTCLEEVDLADAAAKRVGVYSHGMQKRLSVARAMLMEPAILLVDEATHDLDPDGAIRIRDLATGAARRGAAVLWTTQRVDEIRGFVDRLTLLHEAEVRFRGTVPQMMATSPTTTHLLQLRAHDPHADITAAARGALDGRGQLRPSGDADGEHFLLSLPDDVPLGQAVATITSAGIDVLACREEHSPIESAFLALTGGGRP
jgi:ABC-type multidrug transport system ATPase subunit